MPGRRKPPKTKAKTRTTSKSKAKSTSRSKSKSPPKRPARALGPPSKGKKRAAKSPKKTAVRAKVTRRATAPPPVPSEQALAASAQRPVERSLGDDEREALCNVAETARKFIKAVGGPDAIVHRLSAFLDEVRAAKRPEPEGPDIRLGLGALWGEQVRAQVGWTWVHLSYPDGFASYAIVPDDRAFACFPLNRLQELLAPGGRANTTVAVWTSLVAGALPTRHRNAYLVIG